MRIAAVSNPWDHSVNMSARQYFVSQYNQYMRMRETEKKVRPHDYKYTIHSAEGYPRACHGLGRRSAKVADLIRSDNWGWCVAQQLEEATSSLRVAAAADAQAKGKAE
jgi:hypothetical protein